MRQRASGVYQPVMAACVATPTERLFRLASRDSAVQLRHKQLAVDCSFVELLCAVVQ